jgi:hypothetical protein
MRNQHEEQKRREKLKALYTRKCELVQLFRISCKIDKKRAGYFPVAKENICIYRLKNASKSEDTSAEINQESKRLGKISRRGKEQKEREL